MKKYFFDLLYTLLENNTNIYLLFGGLGYPRVDEFLKKYPGRAINCEASEQSMLDIAVGLAEAHKIPICYTITPFYLRGFETIRTYINHENLHVILAGAGRGDDYSKDDGFSHDATDIRDILKTQKNIIQHYPESNIMLEYDLARALEIDGPHFISLTR